MDHQVRAFRVTKDRVYVASDLENFAQTVALQVGTATSLFRSRQVDIGPLIRGINLLREIDGDVGSLWRVADPRPDHVRLSRDLSEEWTIEGTPTVYMVGPSSSPSFEVVYVDPAFGEFIPVVEGVAFVFEGLFATHRCLGLAELTVFDEDHKVLDKVSTPLVEAQGGRSASNYQRVEMPVPVPARGRYVRIAIRFMHSFRSVVGLEFYLFFARTTLCAASPAASHGLDDAEFSRWLLSQAGGQAGMSLLEAEFDGEHANREHASIGLRALSGGNTTTLYDIRAIQEATSADLRFEFGRVVRIRLRGAGHCSVYCDGTFLAVVATEPGQDFSYELPARYLDGQTHRLELRDTAGVAVLAREYILAPSMSIGWPALQEHAGPRLPDHLAPAAAHRYRALVAHLEAGAHQAGSDTLGQLHRAHAALSLGFEHNRRFDPLTFAESPTPDVSIVIPVHNKFAVTYNCLCALLLAYNKVGSEIIVVDDGSRDETTSLEERVRGIRVVRNDTAQGFVRSCNRGASLVKGRLIVFLNNDTEPTVGWLDEMVAAFSLFDRVGMVGSKLLNADGSLQEAGGIVWGSGNPWNYGRSQNAADPRYCYTRDADYLSGAALMITRDVWDRVEGFSEEFAPAYFEDTDLAFKVRQSGFRSLYVATSVVFHYEGVTGGTDVTQGAKRYQELSRPKFKRKWLSAYRLFGKEGHDPDLEKDREIIGRALFLDYQTPRLDVDAGSYAAVQEMRLVQRLGYKVTFFPENGAYLARHTEELQRRGVEVLYAPFFQSIEAVLKTRGTEFDVVYITRFYVAQNCIDMVRKYAPRAKIIFCNADLHFLRELRSALANDDADQLARATQTRDQELAVSRQADLTLSYNEVEHAVILSHNLGQGRVLTAPWVQDVVADVQPFRGRQDCAFLGGFNHYPNVEAVKYFVRDVMPELRRGALAMRLRIYGSNLKPDVAALANDDDVVVEGYVEDLGEVFDHCLAMVAPLVSGAGLKGKVLQALAHGVPCVLSPIAAEGTGLRHGIDCLIAETPAEWVAALRRLQQDEDLWTSLSVRGRQFIEDRYAPDKGLETMRRAFEAVGLYANRGNA